MTLRRFPFSRALLLASVALVAGCTVGPDFMKPDKPKEEGFTPEPLPGVELAPGRGFPHDRIWAVENGPSGFDPAAPAWITKSKFTVLAQIAKVAAARTAYDPDTTTLHAAAPGLGEIFFASPPSIGTV